MEGNQKWENMYEGLRKSTREERRKTKDVDNKQKQVKDKYENGKAQKRFKETEKVKNKILKARKILLEINIF